MENETGMFHVFEWSIENFSCWNWKIRDKLASQSFTYPICSKIDPNVLRYESLTLELFSRVIEREEHIAARLRSSTRIMLRGEELSFIGPDGSLLCKQHVDSDWKVVNALELPPGPKFADVVAHIRKKAQLHGDELTLRFRMRSVRFNRSFFNKTTIDVFDVSFKIASETLRYPSPTGTIISRFNYPNDDDSQLEQLILKCSMDETDPHHSKIALALQPVNYSKMVSVFTRITVLNGKEDVVRREENGHLFRDDREWTFSRELQTSPEISLIFSFKINYNNKYKHSVGVDLSGNEKVTMMPLTRFFRHLDMSDTERHRSKSVRNSVTVLAEDFMCLYQDQVFSDFQLKCGDVSFPVHRNVLSARSPVFKNMLSTDMIEAASGCMDIDDIDPSTLGLFLTYLYTGGVEDLQSDSAIKLYYAADKYLVPSLVLECSDFLSANVSISNVCDILSLANIHQDDQLTSAAHQFILKNYNDFLRSREWKRLLRSEPKLAADTNSFCYKRLCR